MFIMGGDQADKGVNLTQEIKAGITIIDTV